MAADLDSAEIQSITTALVETFENEKSLDVSSPVKTSNGGFHTAQGYNPKFAFSAKGKGDVPAGIALGDNALVIDGVTGGKTIITSVKEGERHTEHNSWEFAGMNYPNA